MLKTCGQELVFLVQFYASNLCYRRGRCLGL